MLFIRTLFFFQVHTLLMLHYIQLSNSGPFVFSGLQIHVLGPFIIGIIVLVYHFSSHLSFYDFLELLFDLYQAATELCS